MVSEPSSMIASSACGSPRFASASPHFAARAAWGWAALRERGRILSIASGYHNATKQRVSPLFCCPSSFAGAATLLRSHCQWRGQDVGLPLDLLDGADALCAPSAIRS